MANNTKLIRDNDPLTPIVPDTKPKEAEEQEQYGLMLHGPVTDNFARITLYKNSKDKGQQDKTGQQIIKDGDMTVFIQKYKQLTGNLGISVHKLLRICTLELTHQNSYGSSTPQTEVFISLDKYMDYCGITNSKSSRDTARKKLWEYLDVLYAISIEGGEKRKGSHVTVGKMRICDYAKFESGGIRLNFSKPMAQYIMNSFPMSYPLALLKLDSRNESLFFMGEKLAQHSSNKNNIKRGTANIISIEKLLRATKIPSYDAVKGKDRHYKRHIMTPFDNALESLVTEGVLKEFNYCGSKGIKLTKSERQEVLENYEVFKTLYVCFVLEGASNLPAQMVLNFNTQEDEDDT